MEKWDGTFSSKHCRQRTKPVGWSCKGVKTPFITVLECHPLFPVGRSCGSPPICLEVSPKLTSSPLQEPHPDRMPIEIPTSKSLSVAASLSAEEEVKWSGRHKVVSSVCRHAHPQWWISGGAQEQGNSLFWFSFVFPNIFWCCWIC